MDYNIPGQNLEKTGFQYIEDLSTAYWQSEILFTALEADLFKKIGREAQTTDELASCLGCSSEDLTRFLELLESFQLIVRKKGLWQNSRIAAHYLSSDSPTCMKDFFLYRRYMQPQWMKLNEKIAPDINIDTLSKEDDYAKRTLHYVRAMDTLVKEKIPEIIKISSKACSWDLPVLDVGGGAGSFGRGLINATDNDGDIHTRGILFDLPEVIEAAKQIYPDKNKWEGIQTISGDFREYEFHQKFGLIVLSNFLHVYSPKEAWELTDKAVSLLNDGGIIVIHDYFPDRTTSSAHKGALYDISMMMNTYNGQCHKSSLLCQWLRNAGMQEVTTTDLSTDSSLIIAGNKAGTIS